MAQDLQEGLTEDPDFMTLIFELFTLARRHPDIAVEYADLMRRTREHVAAILAAAQSKGIVVLHASPEAVTEVIFSLGDGFALRMLARARSRLLGVAVGRDGVRAGPDNRLTHL